jgi:hypothetical protein
MRSVKRSPLVDWLPIEIGDERVGLGTESAAGGFGRERGAGAMTARAFKFRGAVFGLLDLDLVNIGSVSRVRFLALEIRKPYS